MRRPVVVVLALLLGFMATAYVPSAQARPTDQYSALEKRVSALEDRVARLEALAWPSPTIAPTPPPTVAPTPTATATSAPTPTATAAPTPTPTATPSPSGVPTFGSRPSSPAIRLGPPCDNVTISGKGFYNLGSVALIVEGCNGVTIKDNDFDNTVGGIYALNSTNVTVTGNRFRNIGNGTIGAGKSNYIQFDKVTGGYIADNKGKDGNTEDMISIYASGGPTALSPLLIERNHFESTNWTRGSGSGLMLGDAGGSHIVARFNTLLSPGQVGIGVPGGTDIHVTDNVIYGAQRTSSNVGVYVWNQSGLPCSGIEISRNQVRWYRADGVENPYWNAGNCGTVTESGNNWHAPLDPTSLRVIL